MTSPLYLPISCLPLPTTLSFFIPIFFPLLMSFLSYYYYHSLITSLVLTFTFYPHFPSDSPIRTFAPPSLPTTFLSLPLSSLPYHYHPFPTSIFSFSSMILPPLSIICDPSSITTLTPSLFCLRFSMAYIRLPFSLSELKTLSISFFPLLTYNLPNPPLPLLLIRNFTLLTATIRSLAQPPHLLHLLFFFPYP